MTFVAGGQFFAFTGWAKLFHCGRDVTSRHTWHMYCFSLPRVTWHDSAPAIFCTSSRDILTARHISQLWTGDVAFLLSSQYGKPFVLIVWIGGDKTQWLVQATNRNREVRKFAYSVKPWILLHDWVKFPHSPILL